MASSDHCDYDALISLNPSPPQVMESTSLSGTSHPCPALKSLTNKVGNMLRQCNCSNISKNKRLDAKLQRKMVELRRGRSASDHKSFRSINSIIMTFPRLKEHVRNLRGVFQQYDENGNGTIDRKELEKCTRELQINLTKQEIDDLFDACDVDKNGEIQFNEFIVLLCLIYLLSKPSNSTETVSRLGSPQLEATFDTIVEAFLYIDKNGDGKLNKKDMVMALTDAPWERSPAYITKTRFKEMDKDKDGNVSFREFLFALTSWLGVDSDDEIPVTGS